MSTETGRTDDRPILLLDVDGVLNAVTDSDPKTWGDWKVDRADGFGIRWSPSMIAALTRLAERVEMRWLTTWWDMTDRLAFLGLPPMEVANTREEYLLRDTWWKLPVAQRVYAEGRPVIWIDDDLQHDTAALEWGRSLPPGTLLGISPNTFRGLTPDAVAEIEKWLDALPTRQSAECVRGCTMTPGHDGTCCICGSGSAVCERGCPSRQSAEPTVREKVAQLAADLTRPRFHTHCGQTHVPGPCADGVTRPAEPVDSDAP